MTYYLRGIALLPLTIFQRIDMIITEIDMKVTHYHKTPNSLK